MASHSGVMEAQRGMEEEEDAEDEACTACYQYGRSAKECKAKGHGRNSGGTSRREGGREGGADEIRLLRDRKVELKNELESLIKEVQKLINLPGYSPKRLATIELSMQAIERELQAIDQKII